METKLNESELECVANYIKRANAQELSEFKSLIASSEKEDPSDGKAPINTALTDTNPTN